MELHAALVDALFALGQIAALAFLAYGGWLAATTPTASFRKARADSSVATQGVRGRHRATSPA